jgi:predicted Zn-dependent protease
MPNMIKQTALFLAVASMLVFQAFAQRTSIRPAWNLFSTQQDVEMGDVLADEAERRLRVVEDSKAAAYIDALGKQLAVHAPHTRFPYQFKIVDHDRPNAWALPGGAVYITSGLLQTAQNEPQLAGYVAHQIAHIALRHGSADVSKAYAERMRNTTRGSVTVGEAMSRLNIQFTSDAIPLEFTREQERQASVVATQILFDAGFDPQQMTQAYQHLANQRSGDASAFFNAHPYLSNHGAVARTETRNLGTRRNPRGDSGDFHTVKDLLAAGYGDAWPSISDRDRTSNETPDLPSTRFVLFRSPYIEFRHPDNWNVTEERDAISIAPDDGIVGGSMAYGMTIAVYDPGDRYFGNSFVNPGARAADTGTLEGATDSLIAHLREYNPNLRIMVGTSERRRVDGEQAMAVQLSNDSPLGGRETDWLVTVLRPDGSLRYFIGVAPQRDFNRYQRVFDQIVTSVRLLD